jgi:hypothetical protein
MTCTHRTVTVLGSGKEGQLIWLLCWACRARSEISLWQGKNRGRHMLPSDHEWERGIQAEGLFDDAVEKREVHEDVIRQLSGHNVIIFPEYLGLHCITNFAP